MLGPLTLYLTGAPLKGSLTLKGALQGVLITSGYEVKNVSTFWLLTL